MKKNCKRKRLDTLLKRFGKQAAMTKGTRAADQSTHDACTEENVTTVDELVGLLSHVGQKQAHRSTAQLLFTYLTYWQWSQRDACTWCWRRWSAGRSHGRLHPRRRWCHPAVDWQQSVDGPTDSVHHSSAAVQQPLYTLTDVITGRPWTLCHTYDLRVCRTRQNELNWFWTE